MHSDREQRYISLIHRHRDLIWHVCQDYSLSAAWTAEDAFQEVLCQLWRCLDQYQGRSAERTWVYRIATTTLLEIKRKRSNQPTADATTTEPGIAHPQEMYDLERLIETLGEPDATIVRASLDGFDYREIAAITGLTRGAVAMRLSRAKDKLRKILNHE